MKLPDVPRQPVTPLPAPAGAYEQVQTRVKGLRRRRAAVASGLATAVLALAGATAVVLLPGAAQDDALQVAAPTVTASPVPEPTGVQDLPPTSPPPTSPPATGPTATTAPSTPSQPPVTSPAPRRTPTSSPSTTAPSPRRSASATPSASRTPSASPSGLEYPPEAPARHGERYWAVFTAVDADPVDDAAMQNSLARLHAVGYDAGIGELGCTSGAAEALGLDPGRSYVGVSVFFATQVQAQQFVALYGPAVVGTAYVQAFCLD